ncbi:hypothetical protein ABZP36_011278 [Zizania latifolia]
MDRIVRAARRREEEEAAMAATLGLMMFHKTERDFFHRLVRDLGQEPAAMRWVMALWLWLETAGHHDFISRVAALPGPVVLRFVDEALACLARLPRRRAQQQQLAAAAEADGDTAVRLLPCTNALLAEPIDGVAYFDAHRDEVMEGVGTLYKNVCRVVFDDSAAVFLHDNVRASLQMGGSTPKMLTTAASSPLRIAPMPPPPGLNPMASPWFPVQQLNPLPEDYRSLFITFSRGYPINQEDITAFFNSAYGPCVESVMVEKAAPGQLPVYGRVVLRSAAMIPVVLDGQQTAKFMINGRHLWARIYVPSSKPANYA